MAKSKAKRPARKQVIDVGEPPAEKPEEQADPEEESEDEGGVDVDIAAGATIDVSDEAEPVEGAVDEEKLGGDDDDEPKVPATRGGSLARRDPMSAYMAEARRYPLLTPEEEKDLAVRLVEHGDTGAA